MARSYPYGKVPGSVGTVISERFESPMVCCGYCSAHFAARAAKAGLGSLGRNEGHKIRAAGGRAHNAGSNSLELRNGSNRALGVTLVGIKKGDIIARVKAGYTVVVTISYAKLPAYLKVQNNDFGHSIALKGHRFGDEKPTKRNYLGVFDPLWLQGSQGTWARWIDIRDAIHDVGHNTTTVKR